MEAKVFFKENGQINFQEIKAETVKEICRQSFMIECESYYRKEVKGIEFEKKRLVGWESSMAHWVFAEGKFEFTEFLRTMIGVAKIQVERGEACYVGTTTN